MHFEKLVNIAKLTKEIQASAITVALDHINSSGSACDVVFKAELSEEELTILDNVLALHNPAPIINTATPVVNVESTPFIGSKTIAIAGVTKKLFARHVGIQQALTAGANEITYTGTFAWTKLVGLEVVNSEALDIVDLKVYDNDAGSFSGVPNLMLNQFGFSVNMPKDFYIRMAQFDADFYATMVIKISYNSVSAKTIGINFLMNEVK
jgi:hypothetical protein